MADEAQYADGSYAGIRERDGLQTWRSGGYAAPAPNNTSSVGYNVSAGTNAHNPGFLGGSTLHFNIGSNTSSIDTVGGGGLLSWQNTLGYDIIVTSHQLDITSPSSNSCTASAGSSTNSTGTSTNMINAQQLNATATVNGGSLSVKVAQNNFIVAGRSAGTSSGLIARSYFTFVPAPQPGSG